jgi:PAS domain S-box-containing protein
MTEFFRRLFSSDEFMPHGHCYLWQPGVLGLHIVSDALITLAYFSIPFTLLYFVRKRKDLQFNWMFICFAVFIVACGTTHLMEIWVIWHPTYWLSGGVKAVTALASVPTAILLIKLIPDALRLPSPSALQRANTELEREIADRKQAEAHVRRLNEELERRVMERTLALEKANQALVQEVRERQRAAHELRDSEGRLRAVFDASPNAVIVIDNKSRILTWNGRAEAMFGWMSSEAVGRDLAETVIPPHHREAHRRGMEHVLAKGEEPALNRLIEMSAVRRDGSEFPVELSISRIKTGEVATYCGFITDITERKQAEVWLKGTLKEVSDLKAALDEHAIVAITDPTGRITYANDKFCTISKYSHSELVGQDHRIVNSGYHPKEFIRDLWTTIGRGKVWRGEIKNRAKDGSHYWVDTTIVPFLRADGRPYQYVAIRADITERKRAEEQITQLNQELEQRVARRTAELQAVNKELEAFCYSVSHDLRAPLRHIDGFVGLLNRSAARILPEQNQQYLERIGSAAKQMGRLIDDLLVFSRMGRAELQQMPVDLGALVEEAIHRLQPETQGRNVVWKKGPLPEVQADPAMLRQVLANLLSNAVKYTRPRNPAEIEIGCSDSGGEEVVIHVRDNGVGFDMEYAAKLFGVFQRLHSNEDFEGTGIGLANVRRIIARHGGRTWAEGAVNLGATFYFTLPKRSLLAPPKTQ